MFNNTFNRNRKDPLVDSIKAIMEDTHMRNQAEGLVCEAFGVLNKNALANEEVTPFELACEEIYNQLKEGVQIDELYGKGRLKDIKHARSKETYKAMKKAEKASDVEHDERGYRTGPSREDKAYGAAKHREEKADMVAQKLKHHRKKMGFNEELAKKDYDKDGKIESPKDEVWGSRLRAAKMAGKMEEEQIDERNLLKRMKDTMRLGSSGKERVDRISGALSDRGGNWDYKKGDFTEKGKSQVKSRLKNVKGASDYALNKEETQIDELSRDTLKSYVKKASKDMRKTAHEAGKESEADDYWGREGKSRYDRKPLRKSGKRLRGIQKATDRLEETVFEELYINLNEKALWAIENGRLQEFVDNLTEEEFDFLDEEIVNELSSFGKAFAAAKGRNFTWHGKSFSGARADSGSSSIKSPEQKQAANDAKNIRAGNSGVTNTTSTGSTGAKFAGDTVSSPKGSAADTYGNRSIGSPNSSIPTGPKGEKNVGVGTGSAAVRDTVKTNMDAMKAGQSQAANDAKNVRAGNSGQTNPVDTKTDSKGNSTSFASNSGSGGAADRYGSQGSSIPGGTSNKNVGVGTGTSEIKAATAGAGAATGGMTSGGSPSSGMPKTPLNKPSSSMNESVERKGFVTVGNMRIKLL